MENNIKFKGIIESKTLIDYFKSINTTTDEIKLNITKENFNLSLMSPDNVSLVNAILKSSTFYEYNLSVDNFFIELNLSNLLKTFKPNVKDKIQIIIYDIRIELNIIDKINNSFPLCTLELKENDIPKLNYNFDLKINSKLIYDMIKSLKNSGDKVIFSLIDNKLMLSVINDTNNSVGYVPFESTNSIDMGSKCKYSVPYLLSIFSNYKLSEYLTINFSKDYPLKITYESINKYKIVYILAPLVGDD
jgi:DNA polymerase III sliding clamp (beta) subunit (PCNA family)